MREVEGKERNGEEKVELGMKENNLEEKGGRKGGKGLRKKRDIVDIIGVGIVGKLEKKGVERRESIKFKRMDDEI